MLRADRAADGERDDDEGEPSEDGLLAVLGAPAPGTRCDVPCGGGFHGCSIRRGRCPSIGAARRLRVWLATPFPWTRYQGSSLVSSRMRSRGGGSGGAGSPAAACRSALSMRASSSAGSNGLTM